jgi:hypothetical protein
MENLTKKTPDNLWAPWLILVLGSFLSIWATINGFSSFIGADLTVPWNAILLVIIVQCVMVLSAGQIFKTRKLLFMITYVAGMSFSVFFGIPYFMAATGLENQVSIDQAADSKRKIMGNVQKSRQTFMALNGAFLDLANYSQDMSETEYERAGTCFDGDTQIGDGPRRRLRRNDEIMTNRFAANMTNLNSQLDGYHSAADVGRAALNIDEIFGLELVCSREILKSMTRLLDNILLVLTLHLMLLGDRY